VTTAPVVLPPSRMATPFLGMLDAGGDGEGDGEGEGEGDGEGDGEGGGKGDGDGDGDGEGDGDGDGAVGGSAESVKVWVLLAPKDEASYSVTPPTESVTLPAP